MPRQGEGATPAMETEASKTRSLEIAFLVDADSLRQLENLLREVGDSLEYQVRFSDGHAIQYHDVEEILKQPNHRMRSIVSLIAGVTGRGKQSAYVVLKDKPAQASSSFGASTSSPSVEYTVTGTQKNVIYFGDKLDAWNVGIRQWYSAFYRGILSLLLGGAILAGPFLLWQYPFSHLFSQAFLKSHAWLPGAFIVGLWTSAFGISKLFPRATFAIGQGLKRDRALTYLKTVVLAAFIISVLGSAVANWLFPRP